MVDIDRAARVGVDLARAFGRVADLSFTLGSRLLVPAPEKCLDSTSVAVTTVQLSVFVILCRPKGKVNDFKCAFKFKSTIIVVVAQSEQRLNLKPATDEQ